MAKIRSALRKWLGIDENERQCEFLTDQVKHLRRRVGRMHNKPQRYDEIERARKLRRKAG